MNFKSPQTVVMLIILIGTAGRIALAGAIGLGVDESYVAVVARTLSLSYFDHPPLHFWLIWLTAHIAGSENALVLRLPFIGMFAATTWLMFCLGRMLFGEWAGVYAALILNISAVFSLSTGSWLLPDGPLMFLMTAAALVLARLFFMANASPSWRLWLAAGLLTGLGMLAKYQAVFLIFGSLLFMLSTKEYRRLLLTSGPYLAAGTVAIVFLPVLLWNQEHHWVSFLFQSGRGAITGFYPLTMLGNIAGQAMWVLPWIWGPLVWVLLKGALAGPGDARTEPLHGRQWFLCCLAAGPIAFFTAAALWGAQGLFHWQAPGYLLAMPLLGRVAGVWLEKGSKIARCWLISSVAIFLLLIAVLGSHTATGWLKQVAPQWFQTGDASTEALDWRELPGYLVRQGLLDSRAQFVVAAHWIDAGKIDYILGGKLPVVCLNNEPHHFAFLNKPADWQGKNALIIGRKDIVDNVLPQYRPHFAAIRQVGEIPITRAGMPEFNVVVLYAEDFSGNFPMPYGQ
ncbi:glycosyltransferase family 39 protein [Sporomusa aerivorans]|uniref:glycosyltransferase family 39 protein n=1 Tax=Sporomusa aerivorans TaxID=204936 RepID=UPI00352A5B53